VAEVEKFLDKAASPTHARISKRVRLWATRRSSCADWHVLPTPPRP